jgi:hypothetical protein
MGRAVIVRNDQSMDEKTKKDVIILILGVLIGASGYLANSLFLYYTSVNNDKSDIAEGLFLDVSFLNETLVATDQEFLANPGDRYIFVQGTPLYPDHGLYFAYQRDVPKLDRKISLDTVTFYNHLMTAERDRSLIFDIQRLGDARELTSSEMRRQRILTENAAREVNITVGLLPALRQELGAVT